MNPSDAAPDYRSRVQPVRNRPDSYDGFDALSIEADGINASNGRFAPKGSDPFDPYIVALDDPQSPAAEQYRLLGARFEGARKRGDFHGLQKIAITSTVPGEGKTVTSVNLAYVLAKDFGRRVLLIDADLKKPSVWRYCGDHPRPGLSDIMAKRLPPDNVVHPFCHDQLGVLEAGLQFVNPTRVWKSTAIREVLAHFEKQYDYVILDTPPMLTVVDTTLIADVVDALALVVRADLTPRSALQKALGSLPKTKVVGTVFNAAKHPRATYYYQLR